MEYITLLVEGFDQQRLLSQCMDRGIRLKRIRIKDELTMTLTLEAVNLEAFQRLTRNRYTLTVLDRKGARPLLRRFFHKKSTVAGLLLLCLLLFYQSLFISEIRIYGYEHLSEAQLRESLKRAGLYEGASKSLDPDQVEIQMFKEYEEISFIGVKYEGNLAVVQIVEKDKIQEPEDTSRPCHIVAAKEGYVEKVIPREGLQAVNKGTFVQPGDVVITGVMPINDTTYAANPDVVQNRYVHADGDVYAKVIYRFVLYQDAKVLSKIPTGRKAPAFSLRAGNFFFDSRRLLWPFDSTVGEDKKLLDLVRPFPMGLTVSWLSEVELSQRKKTNEEMEREGEALAQAAIKENIPENAQIINKSLKFSPGENIIEVTVMVEAMEEIGKEQPFEPQIDHTQEEKTEEGTDDIGEPAD